LKTFGGLLSFEHGLSGSAHAPPMPRLSYTWVLYVAGCHIVGKMGIYWEK